MKRRIFFAIILIAAAWGVGRYMTGHKHDESAAAASGREELTQNFQLEPGARVEVRGINGPVTVETSDTATAEVHVVRTANNKDDLDYQKIVVEGSAKSLVVRGEGSKRGWWRRLWGGGPVKQEVTLRLPRRVEFEARGLNGQVRIGEIDGAVEMSGINGRVEVAQSAGHAQFSGVNGGITFTLGRLDSNGVELNGINGNVEFRMREQVNAEVEVNGLNGSVSMNLPNVTSQERSNRSRFSARLGTGGAPIDLSGINGNVRFVSAAPTN